MAGGSHQQVVAMTRICITGGPRTGKTTLARDMLPGNGGMGASLNYHADDLIHLGWSEASEHVAAEWLSLDGPWIIEGVAVSRALRKWHEAHPGEAPPCDQIIYLQTPHETLTPGQRSMAKGVETVHREVELWLAEHGMETEYR